ncbi:hypothetical protein EMGBS10_17100, partial [Opitutia bacterium]
VVAAKTNANLTLSGASANVTAGNSATVGHPPPPPPGRWPTPWP